MGLRSVPIPNRGPLSVREVEEDLSYSTTQSISTNCNSTMMDWQGMGTQNNYDLGATHLMKWWALSDEVIFKLRPEGWGSHPPCIRRMSILERGNNIWKTLERCWLIWRMKWRQHGARGQWRDKAEELGRGRVMQNFVAVDGCQDT